MIAGSTSKSFPYTLRRSRRRRRTIAIYLDPDEGLLVAAPARASLQEIEAFVRRKSDWIANALGLAAHRERYLQRDFVSGETLPYLGETLQLQVTNGTLTGVERVGDRLEVTLHAKPAGARAATVAEIERWYRLQAEELFADRVRFFAPLAGAGPKRVVVKEQKTRWGSCGRDGTLYFNWRLILAPPHVVDYLVVHELCHLRQSGHGANFWRLVRDVMPGYAAQEAELRRDGWKYRLH